MAKRKVNLKLDYLPRLPKDKSPGIGCIGAGFIMADCHLVAYRQAGFNPVAIASRTPARAEEVADRHDLQAYPDYRQLLDDTSLEVIDVAVPPDKQLEVIREIVQRKQHIRGILAQKPLGTDLTEAIGGRSQEHTRAWSCRLHHPALESDRSVVQSARKKKSASPRRWERRSNQNRKVRNGPMPQPLQYKV